MIPMIRTKDGTITFYIKGRPCSLSKEHTNYEVLVQAIKNNDSEDAVIKLFDIPAYITKSFKDVIVEDGVIYYKGKSYNSYLSNQILGFIREGFPISALKNFLKNLDLNPDPSVQDRLYAFLEHGGIPVTESGAFIAYKYITSDWKDCYSNTFDNNIGSIVTMLRDDCDSNHNETCSRGLHVCSLGYLGNLGNNKRLISVLVYPENVVSVPYDYNDTKMRVCRYEVLDEISKGDLPDTYMAIGDGDINEAIDSIPEDDDFFSFEDAYEDCDDDLYDDLDDFVDDVIDDFIDDFIDDDIDENLKEQFNFLSENGHLRASYANAYKNNIVYQKVGWRSSSSGITSIKEGLLIFDIPKFERYDQYMSKHNILEAVNYSFKALGQMVSGIDRSFVLVYNVNGSKLKKMKAYTPRTSLLNTI